jgi:hypothetical protein
VRKETRERLEAFRQQQEEAERKALEDENTDAPKEDQVQWLAPARKRKKGPESSLLKGVKLKRSSSATEDQRGTDKNSNKGTIGQSAATVDLVKEPVAKKPTAASVQPSPTPAPAKPTNNLSLGLGYASSDDDE